jgi:hypothetical protein
MAKIEKTIDIDVNISQAEQALNKFGKSIEGIRKEEFEPLNFAIGELEDRLYEMASAGKTGTKEFNELAGEIGRMKKVIIDTDMVVDGMSQTFAQNLGGAMGGVASGFELAQGAMGAFGASGEAVEEALLKVQSAMAISQGIQGIKESIASFKALKTAVMSNIVVQKALNLVMSMNPIGKILLVVTALGAAIAALWSPIKKLGQMFGLVEEDAASLEDQQKQLNAQMEAYNNALDRSNARMQKRHENTIKLMQAEGKDRKEIHEKELEQLAEREEARKEEFVRRQWQFKMQKKLYDKAIADEDFERAKSIKDEIKANKAKIEELRLQNEDYFINKKTLESDFNNWKKDEDKKTNDDEINAWKQNLQNRKDALRQIQDLELGLMKEGQEKELAEMNKGFDRSIEDTKANENLKQSEKEKIIALYEQQRAQKEKEIRDKYIADEKAKEEKAQQAIRDAQQAWADEEEAFYEEYRQNTLAKDQLEIEAVQEKYFRLIELAKQYGLDTVELERQQAAEIKAINDAKIEADNQVSAQELANAREVAETKLQLASDALGAINDLVQAFAKDDEKSARRAFNINKAVGISQAVISTAQAVMAQLAVPQDALTGVNFIKAGIAAATGAAQIATIAKTKFQPSGGSSGGSASTPSVPSASTASPTFNIVGDTGVNQLAETLGNSNQQPVKAYVVGNDVTTQQSLDRNIVETASI